MMIGSLGLPEIILLVLLVIILFGGKKIPEVFKGLGEGIKNFKKAMNSDDDDKGENNKDKDSDN
jgi:sec-independent protein translocase protein TatA